MLEDMEACPDCGKQVYNLGAHRFLAHEYLKRLHTCPECGKDFFNLGAHIELGHRRASKAATIKMYEDKIKLRAWAEAHPL